jgi:hypothetical protein
VLWAGVFTAINVWQISRIYFERRPVVLSVDEQTLYDFGFHTLRPREFLSLVLVGEWRNAAPGERLLEEGKRVEAICIAIAGSVEVGRQRHPLGVLGPGNVIGTALALMGEPSPIEASFSESARYIRWPLDSLRAFVDRRPKPSPCAATLPESRSFGKGGSPRAAARSGAMTSGPTYTAKGLPIFTPRWVAPRHPLESNELPAAGFAHEVRM